MQSDILFDNVYVGHSIEDAERIRSETFDVKHPLEEAEENASNPEVPELPEDPSDLKFMDDPVIYIRQKVDLFYGIAKEDPLEAIKALPEVAGGIGALVITIIALLVGIVSMSGGSTPPQVRKTVDKVKQSAVDAKDQLVDATSTGAEKAQTEINKRSTRSSGPAE